MKKLLSLLLTWVLLAALMAPALAEVNGVPVELTLADRFELTAAQWCEDDVSRVMLGACVALDAGTFGNEVIRQYIVDAMTYGRVFVGQGASDDLLGVTFFARDSFLLVGYIPATGDAECTVIRLDLALAEDLMAVMIEDGVYSAYYEIPTGDIMTAMEVLVENLSE